MNIPAGAAIAACEALEDLVEWDRGRDARCVFCGVLPRCSHDHECVLARAPVIVAALEHDGRAAEQLAQMRGGARRSHGRPGSVMAILIARRNREAELERVRRDADVQATRAAAGLEVAPAPVEAQPGAEAAPTNVVPMRRGFARRTHGGRR